MTYKQSPLEPEINELLRLLNIQSGRELKPDHPLTVTFKAIDQYHAEKNYVIRDLLIWKILFLIKHLKEIEEYDTRLLEDFRKKLQKVGHNEYFGERLEINIASNLIRKKIKFRKRESPDFEISFNSESVFIECTNSHLIHTPEKERTIIKKLKTSIKNKAKQSYCKPNTALFLDMTNLIFVGGTKTFKKKETKEFIQKILPKTNFGNVTLFAYIMDRETKKYKSTYNRIDNRIIYPNLLKFLNHYYPFGNERVEKTAIPKQG